MPAAALQKKFYLIFLQVWVIIYNGKFYSRYSAGKGSKMSQLIFLEAAADPYAGMPGGGMGMLVFYGVLMIGVILLMSIPQRKQEKKQKAMRDSIRIGDEVVTIGGIIGIVISRDNEHECVVIETGGNRSKIRVRIAAISENLTVHDEEDELGKKKAG